MTWSKTPKCALIDNNIKQTWEPGAYDLPDAVVVDTNGGETTVSLTNTTGSTQTFTATCLDLSIQLDGLATTVAQPTTSTLRLFPAQFNNFNSANL